MFSSISYFKVKVIFGLFLFNFNTFAQPLDVLIQKILKKDENVNSSKIAIEKANNDLSSVTSLLTPKLDLSLPVGNEKGP